MSRFSNRESGTSLLVAFLCLLTSCKDEQKGTIMESTLPSPEQIAQLPPDGGTEFNRLIHEKSPYLLQHARNPVDWFPWCEEAFEKAKQEDKPVFLSVGYSTCHWCHVMERESFENHEIAGILNRDFVAIKVDREERPDIDEIYMNATQMLTGRGGWPNSVWLMPDGRPWYAGTYFPPYDMAGHPGFATILTRLSEIWQTRRADVEQQANELASMLKRLSMGEKNGGEKPDRTLVAKALDSFRNAFDNSNGGFSSAPKFPPHGNLTLLLYEYGHTKDESLRRMIVQTLDGMAQGGIHDHVGGGFHRYSTDQRWLVPHFEKMLYDNAQLARVYTQAFVLFDDEKYRRAAQDTLEWVLREMVEQEGGFYSALDADSEGVEGKYYVWTVEEINEILGEEESRFFCRVYNVSPHGNFVEEATGDRPGTNILHLTRSLEEIANEEDMPLEALQMRLQADRQKLLERREKRVPPHLDDKVLTSWNGLMIGSLAYAGRRFGEPRYTTAAERAAEFILSKMREEGRLFRTCRDGTAKLNAYLDDYAFLADGLLELYESTGNERYLNEAEGLVEILFRHYQDQRDGGFFFTSDDHEDLLVRTKDPFDKAVPSGNGMLANVLIQLGRITEKQRYFGAIQDMFEAFSDLMNRAPAATVTMALALAKYSDLSDTGGPVAEVEEKCEEDKPAARLRKKPLTIEAQPSGLPVHRGESFSILFHFEIDEGWHINSNDPGRESLVPTTITLKSNSVATEMLVNYPEGETITLSSDSEPISVYKDSAEIDTFVSISPDAAEETAILEFEIESQACDDRRCLPPEKYTLCLAVDVAEDCR